LTREQLRRSLAAEPAEPERIERPRFLAVLGTTDGWNVADRVDRVAREHDLARLDARIARLQTRTVQSTSRPVLIPCTRRRGWSTSATVVGAASGQTLTHRTPRGAATVVLVAIHGVADRAA
jgi:hypothetical protein